MGGLHPAGADWRPAYAQLGRSLLMKSVPFTLLSATIPHSDPAFTATLLQGVGVENPDHVTTIRSNVVTRSELSLGVWVGDTLAMCEKQCIEAVLFFTSSAFKTRQQHILIYVLSVAGSLEMCERLGALEGFKVAAFSSETDLVEKARLQTWWFDEIEQGG